MFDVGSTDCVSDVPSAVVSDAHVAEVPEYHWYVYGEVPPVGADILNVIDCPLSMVGDAGVGAADAVSAVLTVTVSVAVADSGEYAESVTFTVAVDVDVGDVVHVCDVWPLVHVTPVHKYEYGEVPPDGLAVNVVDCPESIVGDDGEIVPALSATRLTVTRSVPV